MLLSYTRTVFLYLVLILAVRLMGKRQIGEMEPAEFVVTMLIANLAAIPMQDGGIPLLSGLTPILTVLGVQLVLADLSLRFLGVRKLLCGAPVLLIHEGRILQENLRRCRITLDELTEHLRENGILELSRVQYAVLETNGQISSFPFARFSPADAEAAGICVPENSMPVTLVSDGRILEKNLKRAGKDRAWVGQTLRGRDCRLRDAFLLTVDGQDRVSLIRREGRR